MHTAEDLALKTNGSKSSVPVLGTGMLATETISTFLGRGRENPIKLQRLRILDRRAGEVKAEGRVHGPYH
jgi:hypothetical protein